MGVYFLLRPGHHDLRVSLLLSHSQHLLLISVSYLTFGTLILLSLARLCLSRRSTLNMGPFKLAVIGAGPSAFYVTSRLLSRVQRPMQIDMYDRLWAPHGLVRYGVAPDHPEVKVRFASTRLAMVDVKVDTDGQIAELCTQV